LFLIKQPTVLRVKGYRFFFFSLEGHGPPHIHVESAERFAKFWLGPVAWLSRGSVQVEDVDAAYAMRALACGFTVADPNGLLINIFAFPR
jgi:hypothetical protein